MSLTAKYTIRNSAILLLIFSALATIPLIVLGQDVTAVVVSEELPWWKRVEEFQAIMMKWITALTVLFLALMGMYASLLAKYQEIKGRMDRGAARDNSDRGVQSLHAKIDENTRLTQKASDNANAAFNEANGLNQKIEMLGIEKNQLSRDARDVQKVEVVNDEAHRVPVADKK